MIVDLSIRAAQLIFCTVVLGLSIVAVQWQYFGSAPAINTYAAFAGAFGMLTALVGIASIWVEFLRSIVMMVMDALASIFLLAGGIAMAVMLKGISCSNYDKLVDFNLIDGGIRGKGENLEVGWSYQLDDPTDEGKVKSLLNGRCQRIEADTAFMFLSFIVSIGALVWMFFAARKSFGRPSKPSVTGV